MLEDEHDPDDPAAFLANYRDAFERLGFTPEMTAQGDPSWVWRNGPFEVTVSKFTPETAAEADVPFGMAAQAGATRGGYTVIAAIDAGDETGRQNAHAFKTVKTEQKALYWAARYQKELNTSLAARLTRLGFSGWRNHWHKGPINVSLKPKYVNIDVDMRYVPNNDAIRVLTGLDKMCSKLYPEH